MAGFYPDAPGNRFAYHQDGTQVYLKDSNNTMNQLTTTQLSVLNDEDSDDVVMLTSWTSRTLIVIFPEPRDFTGYYINHYNLSAFTVSVSTDTTNGLDGTWTVLTSSGAGDNGGSAIPGYRNKFVTLAGGVVKAVSFSINASSLNAGMRTLQLYGSIPLTSNPDRLIFWEPVNDNATSGAYFDWGDIGQGITKTKQFRIKNNSSTKTATSVTLASTAVTFGMTVQFSSDGTNYSTSINIGDIAPGATSGVLYVKRAVPATEPLQVQACYFTADAASWS